jgi:hypothetical protein
MQSSQTRLDQFVGRVLMVKPQPAVAAPLPDESDAQRAFNFSLIFTGIQCTLQYIIFPFILPLLGVATSITLPLLIGINILAIVSMIFSLRRFWQINYKHKWVYLLMSIVLIATQIAFISVGISRLSQPTPG